MVVVELNTLLGCKKKLNPNMQMGSLKTAPTLTFERDSQTPNFGNIISLFDFSPKRLLPHGEYHGLWDKAEKACKKSLYYKLLTCSLISYMHLKIGVIILWTHLQCWNGRNAEVLIKLFTRKKKRIYITSHTHHRWQQQHVPAATSTIFQSCFKQEQISKGIITPDSLERSWWVYLPEHGAKHGV